MDTIDIMIAGAAPPPEKQQAIEQDFIEKATRAGAITAHIVKKTALWSFVAEFVDTEKAALYVARLTKVTGTLLHVNIKPTGNEVEN